MFLRFTPVVTAHWMHQCFISFYSQIIFPCMDILHCTYPSVDGHLGYFQFLAIMNNAADIHVWVFVQTLFSILVGIYLRLELLGHMVTLYLACEELPGCFPKWLNNLQPHWPFRTVPISPHSHQHLLLSIFIIIAILAGIKLYLTVLFFFQFYWDIIDIQHCISLRCTA